MSKKTSQIITSAADTTAMPVSSMSRDVMLRQFAAARATTRALSASNRAAGLEAGQAEVRALMNLGAFDGSKPVPLVAKKARRGKKFGLEDVITVVSRAHKMREGAVNLRRFEILEDGMSVKTAHGLGVDNSYLEYYVRNGLIAIS